MVADVQVHQLPDAVLVHRLLAPPLVGHDHLAELGAPVPQVVHAHRLVAKMLIDAIEGVADGGAGQMMEAEGLGDVDGGIVQDHVTALALVGSAVGFARVQDLREQGLGLLPLLDEEVQVRPHSLRLLDARGQDQLLLQLRGDGGGGLPQDLGQLEAGEGQVAHAGILGRLQQPFQLLYGQVHAPLQGGGHSVRIVHRVLLPMAFKFITLVV